VKAEILQYLSAIYFSAFSSTTAHQLTVDQLVYVLFCKIFMYFLLGTMARE